MRVFAFLAVLLLAGMAQARTYTSNPGQVIDIDGNTGKTYSTGHGDAAPRHAEEAAPSDGKDKAVKEACATLLQAYTAADVKAEPADDVNMQETPEPLKGKIKVPLNYDLAAAFDLDVPADMNMESELAVMEIGMDGKVFYNGTELTSKVDALCMEKKDEIQKEEEKAKSSEQTTGEDSN